MKIISLLVTSFLLVSCASVLVKHDFEPTTSLNEIQYAKFASKKGVVLLAADWNRKWNCGGFENTELRSIGFDYLPKRYNDDVHAPDFIVNGSTGSPRFINFAFLLKPGEYAISHIKLKVAKSISDVAYFKAKRSTLFDGDNPKGGTFHVAAGEVVYIGHFALECGQQPLLWRTYLEDGENFQKFVDSYKPHYPYLDLSKVEFRLFKTKMFGYDFELK